MGKGGIFVVSESSKRAISGSVSDIVPELVLNNTMHGHYNSQLMSL